MLCAWAVLSLPFLFAMSCMTTIRGDRGGKERGVKKVKRISTDRSREDDRRRGGTIIAPVDSSRGSPRWWQQHPRYVSIIMTSYLCHFLSSSLSSLSSFLVYLLQRRGKGELEDTRHHPQG